MRYLTLIFALLTLGLNGQTSLSFDKRFVECEDKWVAFNRSDDNGYIFGFIYIDSQAGLTFNHEGTFIINENGSFIPNKIDSTNIKVRLTPNQVLVAIIPQSKFDELKIQEHPDWLKFYKSDTGTIERLYRWGYLYNSWNESKTALIFLEKGYQINPKFNGLEFELAYAYNALQEYNKAISVLLSALETSPKDCYLYKELSYAELQLGQLDKASETCSTGISLCSDKELKSEISYNLAYQYFQKGDKKNFDIWAKQTKKWAVKDDHFYLNIQKMELALKK